MNIRLLRTKFAAWTAAVIMGAGLAVADVKIGHFQIELTGWDQTPIWNPALNDGYPTVAPPLDPMGIWYQYPQLGLGGAAPPPALVEPVVV